MWPRTQTNRFSIQTWDFFIKTQELFQGAQFTRAKANYLFNNNRLGGCLKTQCSLYLGHFHLVAPFAILIFKNLHKKKLKVTDSDF